MVSRVAPGGRPEASSKSAKFPGARRLQRHADFDRVYREGRRHFARHLTVFYLRRAQDGGLRVGFTVGKALGGAVERNRIKRRLREAVRLHWPNFVAPVDVVINPKKSLLKADFTELGSEISRAFEVIGKWQEGQAG